MLDLWKTFVPFMEKSDKKDGSTTSNKIQHFGTQRLKKIFASTQSKFQQAAVNSP